MSEDVLLEALEEGVLTLTMNRPERLNALTGEMVARLHDALLRAAEDQDVGAVVLTGAGRAFCAGGDVKAMAEGAERAATLERRAQPLRRRMEVSRLLHEMPKPTLAMVRGAAAGAGLSLALACDLRIAADTVKLTSAFAKVGLSGDFGGAYFLTQILGTAKAREFCFLSPVVEAAEAARLGLVNRVVPDAELEQETRGVALALARGARVALGYLKANLNAAERGTLAEVLDWEAMRHARCGTTEDHLEAAKAFVEKRPPVFRGL
jgi:2-(1,2-epoxy-1,2-dihydrophenyl)acetyl-CoA isomerase